MTKPKLRDNERFLAVSAILMVAVTITVFCVTTAGANSVGQRPPNDDFDRNMMCLLNFPLHAFWQVLRFVGTMGSLALTILLVMTWKKKRRSRLEPQRATPGDGGPGVSRRQHR